MLIFTPIMYLPLIMYMDICCVCIVLHVETLNKTEFLLRDVGGQVQYRNQWKEAFAGAQVVLYIVSLDDFHKESRKVSSQILKKYDEIRSLSRCISATFRRHCVLLCVQEKDDGTESTSNRLVESRTLFKVPISRFESPVHFEGYCF